MKKIRWGILGCGKIAKKFSADLKMVEGAEMYAVASSDAARSEAFAREFDFLHAFDSYHKLVQSEADVIYIATPHGLHYEHVMLCLRHGKAVLCEKAFALNMHQLNEMVNFARANSIFLMEAFWTRFLPQFGEVQKIIQSGEVGDVRLITADFGFKASDPPAPRLYEPRLGGGALLDIGIYPVFYALAFLGRPLQVNALMDPFPSGVDQQISMILKFNGGALASLHASFASDTPVEAIINGTAGRIKISNRFHNPSARIFLTLNGSVEKEMDVTRQPGNGYQFEARHVQDCLRQGLTESPVWSLNDSLLLMETLDRIRLACGIKYNHLES